MDNFTDVAPQGYQSPLIPTASDFQQRTDKREQQETLEQLPLLKKVVTRLDKRIAATDSIENALVVADKYKTSTENALIALHIVRQQLETERGFVQARIDRLK